MTAQPIDPRDQGDEPYEMIHLGGETAVVVPLTDYRRLRELRSIGVCSLGDAWALGLLAGILYRPLGIAAGVGVVLYSAGAMITHVRAKDFKGMPIPTVLAAVGVVPLLLGVASV